MVTLDIDFSLVVQIINFLVLMVVLNYLLYRPLRKIIAEREYKFSSLRLQASEIKDRLTADEAKLISLSSESTKLAMEKKHEIRAEGLNAQKDLLAKIQDQAAKDLENSRKDIVLEVENAKAALDSEAQVFAWEIAGKILGRSL